MTAALQAEQPPPPFRELVAAEVRAHLARRKISGRGLSKLLGVDQTWVSRRLNGVIPMDTDDLQRIADALGMAPLQLLAGAASDFGRSYTGVATDTYLCSREEP